MVKYNIYWADLNPVIGSEQSSRRPVLIISNNIVNEILPIVTIIPLTSIKENRKIYPTEVFLSKADTQLSKDSVALIHQIRTISKNRLIKKCGNIENNTLIEKISSTLKLYLDL